MKVAEVCPEALEEENRRLKKLLAEAVLDNAALKDLLGKAADACGAAAGGGAADRRARVQRAPRLQADRLRPQHRPLPVPAARRCRPSASGCARWRRSVGGSVIDGWACCSHERGW